MFPMRPALLITGLLLFLALAVPGTQDRGGGGGLFGPPDEPRSGGGRQGGGVGDFPDREDRRTPEALPPEVIELGAAYFAIADYNGDGWISYREARESMNLDRDRFARIDKNRDGRIDADEFQEVFEMSMRKVGEFPEPRPNPEAGPVEIPEFDPNAFDPNTEFQPVSSIEELFGRAETRTLAEGATRQPPFIAGPIPHFRRLDLDLDGEITERDLEELLRPMQVRTRIRAVVAMMDEDESGGISRAEFNRMMGQKQR